jgi:hypothetical protein
MPYIDDKDREKFGEELVKVAKSIENAGQMNYVVTMLIKSYLERKGLRYQNLNDLLGALEGAKLELYRRVVAPYEDEKVESNGDVY